MAVSLSELQDEAARWVAKQDSGFWTESDEAALNAWLIQNPRARGALLHARALWICVELHPGEGSDASEPASEPGSGRFGRRSLLTGSAAAAAAAILGTLYWGNRAPLIATDVGEIRRVPLSDGSIAAVNSASAVLPTFTSSARQIHLEAGEAWFQVAKNPSRPFIVEAEQVRVMAVGTAFSVRLRDGGADIIVTEGVVRAWSAQGGNPILLSEGQSAFISNATGETKNIDQGRSVDRTLAWRSGKIDLAGLTLKEAAIEFNRYNRRRLVIADMHILNERFDGLFRTDDVEGFAALVGTSLTVPVDRSSPDEIRVGRAE